MIDNNKREQSALGRFEIICEAYLNGTERDRKTILSLMDSKEKETFLMGCGLYHLLTDERFYQKVQDVIGNYIYQEAHK